MVNFHNQSPVGAQINSQHVYGNVLNNYNHAPATSDPISYNLGVRLGNAPQIHEDYFVGRDHELEQLQTWLTPTPGKQNVVVLHGMGGIGKTQLSVHFVRNTSTRYTAIFWLNANDEKTIRAGLAALAVETSESSTAAVNADDEDKLVQQARQWLSRPDNSQWLLLYDNYDDPRLPGISSPTAYDIRTYFPSRAHGCILITTRSPRLQFGRQLPMKRFDERHSLSILAARSGRSVENDPIALKLVQRLDGLPLALASAGKYLSQSADSFEDYLQLYSSSWNELCENDYGPDDYEERTLYSTWNISYQRVQQQDTVAGELLALMAYFDNQDLWYELFNARRKLRGAPKWWRELTKSRPRFQRAVATLQDYSLIEVHSGGYGLHPCVHDWTLEHLNHEISHERYRIAMHSVAVNVREHTEVESWVQNRRILPHARRLQHERFRKISQNINEGDWATSVDQTLIGHVYEESAMYQEAEQMYLRALAGFETLDEPKNLDIVYNALGLLYYDEGRLVEAEQTLERALTSTERVLQADPTSTLNMVNTLAMVYSKQARLVEAERMFVRALDGYEKALGSEHTATVNTVHHLGVLYVRQGRPAEAEQMYIRALAGCEKALGTEHTLTLRVVYNLADLYREQGRLVEAEQMYIRALAGYERALGADDDSTLGTVRQLGVLYQTQSRLAEAEQMYVRAVAGYEKALGSEHTSTLDAVYKLGNFRLLQARLVQEKRLCEQGGISEAERMHEQDRLAEAERMYVRAAAGFEKAFGPEHRPTLNTYVNLGAVYHQQGRLAEAEQMYVRAVAEYEKALGVEHASTLDAVFNLGILHRRQGRLMEAVQLLQRVAMGRQKSLGDDHPDTKRVLRILKDVSLAMDSKQDEIS